VCCLTVSYFCPHRSEKEDDGWVLALVYDAVYHRSDLVILDANNFSKGTITCLHLKYHISYGLHRSFTSEVFGKI
jgi:all-trans-8'-apo-beta-carotenal 15,15'-oxygenase